MTDLEAHYRRLLKWYPRAWRTAHGEVLIGTLMDAADTEGRSRPRSGEARSIAMHGLGERFSLRTAMVSAFGALLFAFAGVLTIVIGLGTVAQFGGGWIPLALNLVAAAGLATVAIFALLRHLGLLRPDRVLPALILAVVAWTCAFLTAWSWSVGFDEADAGLVRTPFSLAFGPFFGAGWLIGGISLAIVVLELGRSLPRGARWAAAVAAAAVCPPLIGLAAYSPFVGVLTSLLLTMISVVLVARQDQSRVHTRTPSPVRPVAPRVRRLVGIVALCSAIAGVACALYAVLGSILTPAIDSTRAMQLGLAAGALVGIPLLLGVVLLMAARRPERGVPLWSGMLLVVAAVAGHAVSTIAGTTGSGDLPWLAVIPLALGVGLVTFALVHAALLLRGLVAIATAAAALIPLWGLLVMAGFFAPIAAAALAVWGLRADRRTQPNSAQIAQIS